MVLELIRREQEGEDVAIRMIRSFAAEFTEFN